MALKRKSWARLLRVAGKQREIARFLLNQSRFVAPYLHYPPSLPPSHTPPLIYIQIKMSLPLKPSDFRQKIITKNNNTSAMYRRSDARINHESRSRVDARDVNTGEEIALFREFSRFAAPIRACRIFASRHRHAFVSGQFTKVRFSARSGSLPDHSKPAHRETYYLIASCLEGSRPPMTYARKE